jgi:hypothetical protein
MFGCMSLCKSWLVERHRCNAQYKSDIIQSSYQMELTFTVHQADEWNGRWGDMVAYDSKGRSLMAWCPMSGWYMYSTIGTEEGPEFGIVSGNAMQCRGNHTSFVKQRWKHRRQADKLFKVFFDSQPAFITACTHIELATTVVNLILIDPFVEMEIILLQVKPHSKTS